jgi:hypothetical protein
MYLCILFDRSKKILQGVPDCTKGVELKKIKQRWIFTFICFDYRTTVQAYISDFS